MYQQQITESLNTTLMWPFFKDGKEVYSDSITVLPNDPFVNGKEKVLEFNSVADFDKVKVVLSRKLSWQEKPEKIASYDF